MNMRTTPTPRTQRGAAAVELALLFLPLFILTMGVVEGGRALHEYNTLAKSVRDAARYQATMTPSGSDSGTLVARCLALTGSAAVSGGGCQDAPLLPRLELSMVSVCDRVSCSGSHQFQPTGRGVVNLVSVTVSNYAFQSMVPFVMPSITFGPVNATMVQPL